VSVDLVQGADHFAVIDPATPAFGHGLAAVHSLTSAP
jgi:hypothetical protein